MRAKKQTPLELTPEEIGFLYALATTATGEWEARIYNISELHELTKESQLQLNGQVPSKQVMEKLLLGALRRCENLVIFNHVIQHRDPEQYNWEFLGIEAANVATAKDDEKEIMQTESVYAFTDLGKKYEVYPFDWYSSWNAQLSGNDDVINGFKLGGQITRN